MDVTIAICTRNRAASLRRTLNSLAQMEIPGGLDWETVVVDNGSNDDTPNVIRSFVGSFPIRHDHEPTPGVSYARNRAAALARGTYIVWTDDDVIVDRHWLSAYVAAFARWPDHVVFGGKILPVFEAPLPVWLERSLPLVEGAFALRDFGDRELELDCAELPYGANYAVRAFENKAVPYRLDLGPGTDLYGEETDAMQSILAGNKTWRWIPDAKVHHCIGAQRMTLAYLDDYFFRYGKSLAHTEDKWTGPTLLGAPRWYWRRLCSHAALYATRRLTAGPKSWMEARVWYNIMRGKIEYHRQQHLNAKNANGKARDDQLPK